MPNQILDLVTNVSVYIMTSAGFVDIASVNGIRQLHGVGGVCKLFRQVPSSSMGN